MTKPATREYILGRSPEEYARLTLQARILRPYTERLRIPKEKGLVAAIPQS